MSNTCRRNNELPSLNVIVASLLYLMTRYAGSPSPSLADAIADHFEMLRLHPDGGDEIIASAGRRLAQTWTDRAWGGIDRTRLH